MEDPSEGLVEKFFYKWRQWSKFFFSLNSNSVMVPCVKGSKLYFYSNINVNPGGTRGKGFVINESNKLRFFPVLIQTC